jgi:hypothetical protein
MARIDRDGLFQPDGSIRYSGKPVKNIDDAISCLTRKANTFRISRRLIVLNERV